MSLWELNVTQIKDNKKCIKGPPNTTMLLVRSFPTQVSKEGEATCGSGTGPIAGNNPNSHLCAHSFTLLPPAPPVASNTNCDR